MIAGVKTLSHRNEYHSLAISDQLTLRLFKITPIDRTSRDSSRRHPVNRPQDYCVPSWKDDRDWSGDWETYARYLCDTTNLIHCIVYIDPSPNPWPTSVVNDRQSCAYWLFSFSNRFQLAETGFLSGLSRKFAHVSRIGCYWRIVLIFMISSFNAIQWYVEGDNTKNRRLKSEHFLPCDQGKAVRPTVE